MKFSTAIIVSIIFHLALAVGWGVYLSLTPNTTTLATLDVTSVELSFAEEEAEVAPPLGATLLASAEPASTPPPVADPAKAAPTPPTREASPPSVAPTPHSSLSTPHSPPPTPPPAAPRQARVDAPPSPRKAIKPDYPRGARQRGEEGDVKLELRISSRGVVEAVTVVTSSGYPELDEAAKRAVKATRFTPAKSGKKSVPTTVQMTLSFRLKK